MKTIIYLLCIIFCVGCAEDLEQKQFNTDIYKGTPMEIYAGGVDGIETLIDPENLKNYKLLDGGFYFHNVGWERLNILQRFAVANNTMGNLYACEFGFMNTDLHGIAVKDRLWSWYAPYEIWPEFILSNAFACGRIPTVAQWNKFTKFFRDDGYYNPIYPTFEYANFWYMYTLTDNLVSKRPSFQNLIKAAEGIAIDAPPKYFFGREKQYREWVVDAIQWTRCSGYPAVVILSPHHSEATFLKDSKKYLEYLRRMHANPTIVIVENYVGGSVGPESDLTSSLGVAKNLLEGM